MAKKSTKKKKSSPKKKKPNQKKRKSTKKAPATPNYIRVANIPIEEIAKIKGTPEGIVRLKDYMNSLRRGYHIREKQIARAGLYSYAQDATSKHGALKDIPASQLVKGMDVKRARNALLSEIAKYQTFFESKSSTVEGIQALNQKQDASIFGTDESGSPLDTMTEAERVEFWSLYKEFEHGNPALVTPGKASEEIQQILAEMSIGYGDLDKGVLMSRIRMLAEQAQQARMARGRHGPNVYSGRGNN